MGIAMAMGIFFIVVTMVFVAIAVFLPEWIGITGKKAKEIIADQEEVNPQQAPEPASTTSHPSQKE